jgi:hypothetical protein
LEKVTLGNAYNTSDEIIIDEMQACLLQDNAGKDQLRAFAEKYSAPLRAALVAAGVAPIQVK